MHPRWWNRPENLALFRGPGRCSYCGKRCKVREPHHILAKGMGGNKPPGDSRINLIALGSTQGLQCPCHSLIHSTGSPKVIRATLIDLVAIREGVKADVIESALLELRRCGKWTTEDELEEMGVLRWVIAGVGGSGTGRSGVGVVCRDEMEIPF